MAHEVTFSVPKRAVLYADIRFEVRRDGEKIGELGVSQGGVTWWSKNKKTGRNLDWSQFDSRMAASKARTRRTQS